MFRFEYKVYGNNKCPKSLEGDYNLHIEGCEMTITDKDGGKTTVRCHVEDTWRLSDGLDELMIKLKEKLNAPKKIVIGDVVKFVRFDKIYYPHMVKDWCSKVGLSNEQLMTIYSTIDKVTAFSYDLLWPNKYKVQYIGEADKQSGLTLAYIYTKEINLGMIVDVNSIKKVED